MKRRTWDSKTKTEIVMQGLKGRRLTELCQEYQISQAQYHQWVDEFLSNASKSFETHQQTQREDRLKEENARLKMLVGELMLDLKKNKGEELPEKPTDIDKIQLQHHRPLKDKGLFESWTRTIKNLFATLVVTRWKGNAREYVAILAIVLLGLVIRLIFFTGDGLGDDSNYFWAFKIIYDGHIINSQYFHRFSYWIPQIIIWKLFGINEFTFILPVLLSSIGCIYVVYLIGKELFGLNTGLIAAVLMAVNPFEVLNATLISTDVNLSLYMLLSVYFFIQAQKTYSKSNFFLSALFVFLSFVNKPLGLFILPIIPLFYFRKEGLKFHNFLKYSHFLISLFGLFLLLFAACWFLTGDPFIYLTIYSQGREPFNIAKIDLFQMLVYPKQMFFKNEFGERLHGYYFYTVLLALLFVRKNNLKKILPVLLWFLMLLFFMIFVPHKIINFTPYTAQRIFRYFVMVVPPSIIFVSYFWDKLRIHSKVIFSFLFVFYAFLSVYWCQDSTRIARIAFGETRSAIKYLKSLGDVDVYSDAYFVSKIQRLENGGNYSPKLHFWINAETPKAWKEKFLSVQDGYVVTGGPRLPYYGCWSCIPNLGDFIPPENWKLVKEFNKDLYPPWKNEPLRIWHVGK